MRQFLSLGGGVQSTALFLMSLQGEIDNPCEAAIFSDTGWERDATYTNIEYLKAFGEIHGVPVYTVAWKNLPESIVHGKLRSIPFYAEKRNGKPQKMNRICTDRYKIRPTNKLINSLFSEPVEVWLGFSVDEAHRMRKQSVSKSIQLRYPLIENRFGRDNCAEWLIKHNYPVPVKSSCIGCPLHSDKTWMTLNESELQQVFDFEDEFQTHLLKFNKQGSVPDGAIPYLHKSLKSMRTRPFEKGLGQTDLFDTEHDACDDANCFT